MTRHSRPLRVAWLTPGFPSSIDDPSYVFLAREAAALAESSAVELAVFSESQQPSRGYGPFEVAHIEPRRGPAHRIFDAAAYAWVAWPESRSALATPRSSAGETGRAMAAIRLLRQFRPDVVHSHFAVPQGSCGVTVARAFDAARVVSLRGVDVAVAREIGYGFRLDPRYERRFTSSLPVVDWCLTATTDMRDLAVAAGAPSDRSTVLPNLIDSFWSEAHKPYPKPANCLTLLLSVGGLSDRKGFDRGIRALELLPESTHYAIIGEGVGREYLLDLAAALRVDHRLHLLGPRPPFDVARWMRTADVYWFLSRWEAFGNVLLEAFASGLPIVATPCGIASDLLQDEQDCRLLSRPDDPAELVRLTTEVLGRSVHARDLRSFAPTLRTQRLIENYEAALRHREMNR